MLPPPASIGPCLDRAARARRARRPEENGGMDLHELPSLNALLNTICSALLVAGYMMIMRRRIAAHRLLMIAALVTSLAFLVSYLIYHYQVGSVRFTGQGWIRTLYFVVLISHIILAAAIVPLAIVTVLRALRNRFDAHVRIARWTLPIWIYVGVSGVVVYWMLYRL
jgi:uncharacterized membrane protein YozB (DUF420 family)